MEKQEVENPLRKRMSDKTRYIIVGIVTSIFLILVIVLISVGNKENSTSNSSNASSNITSNAKKERNTSTEKLVEFYKEFDSKKLNVIFFESANCGYCSLEKPIIKQISEDYDMKYYDIDATDLTDEELEEIIGALGIRGATPTTVIVKEGKVVATNEGYLDGKPYVEFFVKNGVLKDGATYKPEEKLVVTGYSDIIKQAKKEEKSLIYLDSTGCSKCIEVRSLLNKLADKNKFKIYYMSSNNISQEDVNKLIDTDLKEMNFEDKAYKENGTINVPLLLVVNDYEIKDYVITSSEEKDYTKVLEKHGFID